MRPRSPLIAASLAFSEWLLFHRPSSLDGFVKSNNSPWSRIQVYPPCSVDTNKTLSSFFSSYRSSPSSSQSASLMRTNIPGRLEELSVTLNTLASCLESITEPGFASSHCFIQDEELFSLIVHNMGTEVTDEKGDVGPVPFLVLGRKRYAMLSLV